MHFTSSPRGARLARLLTAKRLDAWGVSRDGETSGTAVLLVAELCANAVRHCPAAARDFHLAVELTATGVLRIGVSDACEKRPPVQPPSEPSPDDAESGRGLLLVEALADRWGVADRTPVGKTVWCELTAG